MGRLQNEGMFQGTTIKMGLDEFIAIHIPLIEDQLKTSLDFPITDSRLTLKNAILYSITAKAKRIRPLLTIASFRLFNDTVAKIMPVALAMEMVHTYSLIHDDLPAMDNDDYRRGQLTCHKKFSEDIAILAGDTLNTYVFELVATELPVHYPADRILKAIAHMANAFGIHGMSGGQAMDLQNTAALKDIRVLYDTHLRKTARMIEACIEIPAILEGASEAVTTRLSAFGRHLGLLFQITDDILDVTSTKETLGKSPGKDSEQQKLTYVSLLGLEKAQSMAATEAENAARYLSELASEYDISLLGQFLSHIHRRTF